MKFVIRIKTLVAAADRRGAVSVLLACMMVIMAGMVAFAVDLGFQASVKAQMRAAADASALAAAGAMVEAYDLSDVQAVALDYANNNVPDNYGTVLGASDITFGRWEPATGAFTPDASSPDAVRVVLRRSQQQGNAVPYFFAAVFGKEEADMTVEAIAVGAVPNVINEGSSNNSVYVTSTKDLSNVVLEFADGSHQKFEGLKGYTGTFSGTGLNDGKEIVGVWIKSGCNSSSDGPGYGERLLDPMDGSTVVGKPGKGCSPQVTATFEASGVTFQDSGSPSPVRLVK
jgi:Flp pilus assembly protein TadG